MCNLHLHYWSMKTQVNTSVWSPVVPENTINDFLKSLIWQFGEVSSPYFGTLQHKVDKKRIWWSCCYHRTTSRSKEIPEGSSLAPLLIGYEGVQNFYYFFYAVHWMNSVVALLEMWFSANWFTWKPRFMMHTFWGKPIFPSFQICWSWI